jgi:hypothetical protein
VNSPELTLFSQINFYEDFNEIIFCQLISEKCFFKVIHIFVITWPPVGGQVWFYSPGA